MTDSTPPGETAAAPRSGRRVLVQILALTAATLLLFRGVLPAFLAEAVYDPEKAVLLTLPILVGLWVWRRHDDLVAAIRPDWATGAALWLLGVAAYAAFSWPLNYHQPRVHAFTLMVAGIIAFCGGRRLLATCLPVVALVGLAIPVGERILNALLGRFEGMVADANLFLVNRLPGTTAELASIDLFFVRGGEQGVVALGTPDRALGTFLPLVALGVLIVFARRRPLWQLVLACGAVPVIALAGGLLRLFTWSAVTILGDLGPLSDLPRILGTVVAFGWAWLATAGVVWILASIVQPPDDPEARPATPTPDPTRAPA